MKKKYKDELDEIFEDMNSYTGEKLREDELFDRVLDFLTSHNTELLQKIEMMKIQYIWDNGACTECGYDTMDEEVIHPCKAYNQALDEVINLINQQK